MRFAFTSASQTWQKSTEGIGGSGVLEEKQAWWVKGQGISGEAGGMGREKS